MGTQCRPWGHSGPVMHGDTVALLWGHSGPISFPMNSFIDHWGVAVSTHRRGLSTWPVTICTALIASLTRWDPLERASRRSDMQPCIVGTTATSRDVALTRSAREATTSRGAAASRGAPRRMCSSEGGAYVPDSAESPAGCRYCDSVQQIHRAYRGLPALFMVAAFLGASHTAHTQARPITDDHELTVTIRADTPRGSSWRQGHGDQDPKRHAGVGIAEVEMVDAAGRAGKRGAARLPFGAVPEVRRPDTGARGRTGQR